MSDIRGGLDDHNFWVKAKVRLEFFLGSPTQIRGMCCHIGAADYAGAHRKKSGRLEGGGV